VKRLLGVVVLAGAVLIPSAAAAQGAFPRVWVDVNFGAAIAAEKDFSTARTNTLYGEPADFKAAYTLPTGLAYDFGGGFMFIKRLGAGVSVSRSSADEVATMDIKIPSPYYFASYGTDTDTTTETMPRTELGIHIQAMFVALDTGKLRIRIFGGPSMVKMRQTAVTNIKYTQTISGANLTVNTVNITGYDKADTEDSVWGYHLGGDVSYFFSRVVGAGGFVRYSGGSLDVANPLGPSGAMITLKVGGLQMGGGLRLRF
jgi:hypothetical protein